MRTTAIRIVVVVVLAVTALGVPAASAAIAQDAWTPPRTDMRSPDARDAAQGRGTFNAPGVVVVDDAATQQPRPAASDGGVDWEDAGIGAAVIAGIALLASSGVLVARRRSARAAA